MDKEKIISLIAKQLDVEEDNITMETNLIEDLEADSLDIADLVMELEEQLDIEIDDEELENLKTVGDIVSYIEKQ
jgi:acyl carrier protein